jgi:hypothetical protein
MIHPALAQVCLLEGVSCETVNEWIVECCGLTVINQVGKGWKGWK